MGGHHFRYARLKAKEAAYAIVNQTLRRSAGMAELADAADSKPADLTVMGVQFPLPAPIKSIRYKKQASSDAFFYAQTMTNAFSPAVDRRKKR